MTESNSNIKNTDIGCESTACDETSALILGQIAQCIRRSTERLGERVCPVCGKLFYPPDDEWAYRRAGSLICSWHCICAYDRAEKESRERRRREARVQRQARKVGRISDRDREIFRARSSGESSRSIAARYFLSPDHIRRIVRRCARIERMLSGQELR